MSFLDIVSKFNQQADVHSKSQSLNPFSDRFEQQPSRSPSPRFSREEYGKPIAGSKTDLRGRKAKSHICREILELCTVIHDVGTYNSKKRDPDDSDDGGQDDGTIIISFGELFQIYTKISDKVVGLLIAAKRRGFVYFDREILFQRRDDDVLIALLKPMSEISKILKDDISQANAPAPVEPKPVEKKKTSSPAAAKGAKSDGESRRRGTAVNDGGETTAVDGVADAASGAAGEETRDRKTNCNGEVDGVDGGEGLMLNNVIEISEPKENDNCARRDVTVEDESNDNGTEDERKTGGSDGIEAENTDDTENAMTDKTDGLVAGGVVGSTTGGEADGVESEKSRDAGSGRSDETYTEAIDKTETIRVYETENVDEKLDEDETEGVDRTETETVDETTIEGVDETELGGVDETEIEVDGETETGHSDETKTEVLNNADCNDGETGVLLDGNAEEVQNVRNNEDVSSRSKGLVDGVTKAEVGDGIERSNDKTDCIAFDENRQ